MNKGEIILKEVTKKYKALGKGEEFVALDKINLTVNSGERIGLIGGNGSGKTTLLKIIAKIARPTGGQVEVEGKVNSLLEIGAGFHPDLTGFENIMLNAQLALMTRGEVEKARDEIIQISGISKFINKPFYTYSSGMKLKLAFAVAVMANPDILIFDEVVSMGDEKFIEMFKKYFKSVLKKKKTIIFATHVLEVLPLYCEKTVWLEKGKIKMMGGTARVIEEYRKKESKG
jgi:teichoic acid transport system ATP-binding protein